jgi:glycosyltransferase involved in cell wall biosynthesis
VGKGGDLPKLLRQAESLIQSGAVKLMDGDPDVMSLVSQAGAGVLMTDPRWAAEGLSNSIMEYMACGLPVVCSAGGGNAELVLEGRTGFIIRPGSPPELARTLDFLRGHPAVRHRLGVAGKRRIMEQFTIQHMVEECTQLYSELVAG